MAASAVPALTSNGFTPEPVQRVQELAESGIKSLPPRYIKPEEERKPTYETVSKAELPPVVDLSGIEEGDVQQLSVLSCACREWGVFQVGNHGIPSERLKSVMRVSRGFFDLPMAEKLKYANNPVTYEGYGSRLGVQKGIPLDWNDYYFHLLRPISATNGQQKWPRQPTEYRRVISEYGEMVMGLCKRLLSIFSRDLKLEEEGSLLERLGGESGLEASYRMNYYPKCPQPELALGLSPHTDPGAMTVLLQDVPGLQVQRDGLWFSVPPVEGALVVILGDQLEVSATIQITNCVLFPIPFYFNYFNFHHYPYTL
uniref:Fe2OG dioxygenase domain-containing protein n=1 Tax=Nelumbo nucifera TaxID=4432 RepID=A0A822ZMB7_NELNU|nr:TPA_asm: hypothetical protein HUJ06_004582 [Nelumbo nucifera]